LRIGPPRRNQADLFFIFIAHGVDHGQERRPNHPDGDPTIFSVVLLVVILLDSIGIEEHARGRLEAHAVLALVRQVLVLIP
jgi:hypothetical protein